MKTSRTTAQRFAWVGALVLAALTSKLQSATVVWTGPPVTIVNAAGSDPSLPENQDRITDSVWLTRAGFQGIYNIASETSYAHHVSPAGTEWAYGTTADYATLTYTDWETWTGTPHGSPPSTVGRNAVLHLLNGNIYIDIKFTAWGGSSGGFTYVRSTAPLTLPTPLEAWRQQFFNITTNTGDAADNFDFDNDGLVNIVEFAFGLNPRQGDSLMLPLPQVVAGVFGVSFTQPAGVSGITYGAQWSSSLTAASWTPIADTGTGSTHTFNVPVGSNPQMFMRYVVTVP